MLRDQNGNGRFEESEVFTYTKDHLGSIKDITDANAELKQRYGYSAYGVTKLEKDDSHSSNQFVENPYVYTSREWEQETGCYYYRARWYCPGMQGFISPDPIGLQGGPNEFLYTFNNPLLYDDPFGNAPPEYADPNPNKNTINQIYSQNNQKQQNQNNNGKIDYGKLDQCINTARSSQDSALRQNGCTQTQDTQTQTAIELCFIKYNPRR